MDTINLKKVGVGIPEILLPSDSIDMHKWSVVACDQYTSQPEYWSEVEQIIDGEPSTFNLILPEIYLEVQDRQERINKINENMEKYLEGGILVPLSPGFIYTDRKTTRTPSRKGLIMCVDLEKYDYSKGSQSLIRATEGTVIDRLPPRVRIRQDAIIELPHIMILIDDPEKTVLEPLAEKLDNMVKLYDFDLMMKGGHIKGYKIDDKKMISGIVCALEKLADPNSFRERYKVDEDKGVLLFAVGDGNHSLASAKVHWENIKKTLHIDESYNHPARYALVEIVNVHDEGISFEPIHRVLFNVNPDKVLGHMLDYYKKHSNCELFFFDNNRALHAKLAELSKNKGLQTIPFITKNKLGIVSILNPVFNIEAGTLQDFLDNFLEENPSVKIDYIHGENVVASLGSKEGNIGFFLPPMDKCDLFKTVILDGALPRKTFSMGEAEEKRFYLECRKIIK
ncbi:MAG: DUF1015 domain-containing protein [Acetivibrionales bacterium]|jgi:uncharacterized protein (DUF1015 family)